MAKIRRPHLICGDTWPTRYVPTFRIKVVPHRSLRQQMRCSSETPQINQSSYVRKCYKNNRERFTCTNHAVTCFNIAVEQGEWDSIIGSYMPILLVRVSPPFGIFSWPFAEFWISLHTQWQWVLPQFACRPCGSAAIGSSCQSFNEAISQTEAEELSWRATCLQASVMLLHYLMDVQILFNRTQTATTFPQTLPNCLHLYRDGRQGYTWYRAAYTWYSAYELWYPSAEWTVFR